MTALRVCLKCGKEAWFFSDLIDFKRNKRSKHGYEKLYSSCHQLHKHPQSKASKARSNRKWNDKNPDYQRRYRSKRSLK